MLICFQVLNAIRTDQRICLEKCIKYGLAFSWLRGEEGDCWETMTKMKIVEAEKDQGEKELQECGEPVSDGNCLPVVLHPSRYYSFPYLYFFKCIYMC